MIQRSSQADVAVIGAGAVGLAIAWRAAARGLRVTVLERGRIGSGTTHHAAGMLAPIAEVAPGEEPLLALGLRSARAFPQLVSELETVPGAPAAGYVRCGTLLVARDGDEAEALERELALRLGLGLAVTRLRASAARRLEPALAPALRLALDVPDDHAVDPRALVAALAAAVRADAGGELREDAAVASLDVGPGGVRGVRLADGARVAADAVVIAAGVWSPQIAGLTAEQVVPLRPLKGQIMRLHDPAGAGLISRVIRMGSSYITPRGDGRYVIGATSEERGFDQTVTAGATFELLRDAAELVPGISELVIDELSAGLRPATPDNLPAIGRGAVEGLWWAVGHRRGGILLAPATAELIVDGLLGAAATDTAAPFDPRPFDPLRFGGAREVAAA